MKQVLRLLKLDCDVIAIKSLYGNCNMYDVDHGWCKRFLFRYICTIFILWGFDKIFSMP